MTQPQTEAENEILIDYIEQRIPVMEAIYRLEDIGFEPPQAKVLLEAWVEFVKEQESIQ
jgi:hypothetical protein